MYSTIFKNNFFYCFTQNNTHPQYILFSITIQLKPQYIYILVKLHPHTQN